MPESPSPTPLPPVAPRHVAVVMDGNGRWANLHQLPRIAGHRRGVEVVKNLAPLFAKREIPFLTLFAFSSENWKRPNTEVKLLLDLLASTFENESQVLHENQVRLRVIGELSRFPRKLQSKIQQTVALTQKNRGLQLTIAINYGGRWDITQACQRVAELVQAKKLRVDAISPEILAQHLCTHNLPEPDLLIRTGGDVRISNFLLWQLAYTELYFADVYWPEFDEGELDRALLEYARRQRRFGKTSAQVAVAKVAQ